MAATLTIATDGRGAAGDKLVRRGTGNLGTYATGGIAVTKANCDLPVKLSRLEIDPAGGYIFEASALTVNGATIKAYRQKDPAAAGGADIPLPEVANAVDLSAVTFNWTATGN